MFAWEICMRYRICDSQGGHKLILGPNLIRKITWPLALMIKDLDILCSSSINLFIKAKKKKFEYDSRLKADLIKFIKLNSTFLNLY